MLDRVALTWQAIHFEAADRHRRERDRAVVSLRRAHVEKHPTPIAPLRAEEIGRRRIGRGIARHAGFGQRNESIAQLVRTPTVTAVREHEIFATTIPDVDNRLHRRGKRVVVNDDATDAGQLHRE